MFIYFFIIIFIFVFICIYIYTYWNLLIFFDTSLQFFSPEMW